MLWSYVKMDAWPFIPINSVWILFKSWVSPSECKKLNPIWSSRYKGLRNIFSFFASAVEEGKLKALSKFWKNPVHSDCDTNSGLFDTKGKAHIQYIILNVTSTLKVLWLTVRYLNSNLHDDVQSFHNFGHSSVQNTATVLMLLIYQLIELWQMKNTNA